MIIPLIKLEDESYDQAIEALRQRLRGGELVAAQQAKVDVPAVVREIISAVAQRGDEALLEYTAKLDGVQMEPFDIAVAADDLDAAYEAADREFLAVMERAVSNIRQYQEHILVPQPQPLHRDGRTLGVRYEPLARVGIYVPGGRALYPSTVLMTVVPAQVAGVRQIALASPPTTNGDINPMVLALARMLNIDEVYRVGGAQAIAAMALGTDMITPVDKVAGPGNAFVAEAKRQLLGKVGIDSIAGPSEVVIVADDSADPRFVAADLLAQAEHDPGSAVLITPSLKLAAAVTQQIEAQLASLSRSDAIRRALVQYGAIIQAQDLEQACEVANGFAAEHLQIVTSDDIAAFSRIRQAGAIFLGPSTPVALGDYYAGPSHVLPTGGTARFFSALSCNDFRKASSVIHYDPQALAEDADDVIDFATREGLTAHANAVRIRKQKT